MILSGVLKIINHLKHHSPTNGKNTHLMLTVELGSLSDKVSSSVTIKGADVLPTDFASFSIISFSFSERPSVTGGSFSLWSEDLLRDELLLEDFSPLSKSLLLLSELLCRECLLLLLLLFECESLLLFVRSFSLSLECDFLSVL